MKKTILLITVSAAFTLSLVSCGGSGIGNKAIKTDADSAAYAIGLLNGKSFASNLSQFPGDSIDRAILLQGLKEGLMDESKTKMTAEDAEAFMQRYFEKAQKVEQQKMEEQAKKNAEEETKFLEENKGKEGVITTESGLQYRIDSLGTGAQATSDMDQVKVNYTGKTLDGHVFDSSIERGEPATFTLSHVIPGWTEGLKLVPAGSKFTLWIPARLAYGKHAPREIGPDRMLVFDCELLEVIPAEKK